MGWKPHSGVSCKRQSCMLSENQCGMETPCHKGGLVSHFCVEREPMWDGNGIQYPSQNLSLILLSENQCGMETVSNHFVIMNCPLVEREPMWDGNASVFSALVMLSSLLSENQCGMETTRSQGAGPRRWELSENQCGMETVRQIGGRAGRPSG